jgi:hypothetical protein
MGHSNSTRSLQRVMTHGETLTLVSMSTGTDRLPLAGLLALSNAAFLTILTQALPAEICPT